MGSEASISVLRAFARDLPVLDQACTEAPLPGPLFLQPAPRGCSSSTGGKRYGVAAGCRRRAVCSTVGGQPRVLQAAVETECLVGGTGVVCCWPGQLIDGSRAPRNHTKLGTGMASSIRLCVTVAAVVGTHARCALLEVVGCWWATKGGPLA